MKHLTIEDVQPLQDRLQSLDDKTIIGFPETTDNGVLRLKAFNNIGGTALFHLSDMARATIGSDLQQRFPLRAAGWPAGIRTRDTKDWHDLRVGSLREGVHLGNELTESKKKQFVAEFNALMDTATGEGWLLGFSWNVDTVPVGDFGIDPPSPEISRILMPQEPGTVGLRESLIGVASLRYGDGVAEAVHSAVINLGLLA